MTKEHEQAIKTLENFIDHFQTLIKQADKANDEAFDREQAEQDIADFKTAIQAIEDLDKMNGIALDLAAENDELIEKLDAIRAEIEINKKGFPPSSDYYKAITRAVNIIDNYRGVSKDADGD